MDEQDNITSQVPMLEPPPPVYGPDGKLTHDGMRVVLARGGSVLYNGSVISDVRALPSEATLAKGDAAKMERARTALEAQRRTIDAQLAQLGSEPEADETQRQVLAQGVSLHPNPDEAGVVVALPGEPGEGDTAGLDGDVSDPDSEAAKKAEEQAKAQEEARKAAEKEVKRLAREMSNR